jgi:hypothetical protein
VGSHIFGFRTQIKIIEHGNPGNGFITNEFWLLNYSGHNSWIELGYMDDRFSPELQYFFAVNDETGIFTNTIIGYVPKEEIGRVVTFSVHQLSREDRFRISVNGPITRFSTVTDVHMWPGEEGGHVEMGQELAGTTGAKASVAIFDQNFVYVRNAGWQPLVEPLEGPFLAVSRPPFGEWLWPPTMFSREGGLFATRCCTQVP